jgi:hypothetical protein
MMMTAKIIGMITGMIIIIIIITMRINNKYEKR